MHQHIRIDLSFTSNPAASFRTPQSRPSTFAAVAAVEPRVANLVCEAARLRASRRVTWRDYEAFKRRLLCLVGWNARRPELRTTDAYDLAMHRLVAALGV